MSDSTDPNVNPQADRPGEVEPQRTPGSAPSVVPLPDGADPDAPEGSHPLPEEAIDGYPVVNDLYEGEEGAPASSPADPASPAAEESKPEVKADPKAGPKARPASK
jgi:hypothetical protein